MHKPNNTGVAKLAARPLNNTGVVKACCVLALWRMRVCLRARSKLRYSG
ncbi:MAG: hypothetical protein P9X24_07905 [Candidatus Hatepunaea meridiana]|nr:hypothetical protein [Candidatus Hatepunaea meridiana]